MTTYFNVFDNIYGALIGAIAKLKQEHVKKAIWKKRKQEALAAINYALQKHHAKRKAEWNLTREERAELLRAEVKAHCY